MISLAFPQPDSECLCTPTSEPVIPLVLAAAAVTLAFPCIILLASFVTGRASPKSCTFIMLDHGVSFLRWSLLPGKTIAPGVCLSVQPTKEKDSEKIYIKVLYYVIRSLSVFIQRKEPKPLFFFPPKEMTKGKIEE